jgi:hypothetical protein
VIQQNNFQMNLRGGYQQADGYREQTAMNRWMAQAGWKNTLSSKTTLVGTVFSTRLYYQTPGGLTLAQYNADPRQARPATPAAPGAVAQQAAITNQTTYGGLMLEQNWSSRWTSHLGMFGSVTDFRNPTIRNYEIRNEENWGGRGDTRFQFSTYQLSGKITAGVEYQHFFSPDVVYDNNGGTAGNIQTDDRLRSQITVGFLQTELSLPKDWFVTIGGSGSFLRYDFLRISLNPEIQQQRTLHTNSAAGTVPRLLDMGAEAFLIVSTINVVIGQRLVRRLETNREKYMLSPAELKQLGEVVNLERMLQLLVDEKVVPPGTNWDAVPFYRAKASGDNDGFQGRLGIYEVMPMSLAIREAVMQGATGAQIEEQAKKEGMMTMIEDGVFKAVQGLTTIEEVLRVITE